MAQEPFGGDFQNGLFENEQSFKLDNYLPMKILSAARGVERALSRLLQTEYDLSLAEWRVLSALMEDEDVSVRELSRSTGHDLVAISRAATRLRDRKLIKKTENKQDRRLVVLKPVKSGRTLCAAVNARLLTEERAILKGLGAQDRVRFGQFLGVILANQQTEKQQ